jgi:hypothetical protein
VLLLDADNVAVRDPDFLFDHQDYRDTGALFWPDIVRLSPDNPVWAISGLSYRDTPSIESGQLVLDKSRCWRALALAHWINQHSDRFYGFLHGDKDTFLIAWLMLDQPYHLIRHRPKLLDSTICQRLLMAPCCFNTAIKRNGYSTEPTHALTGSAWKGSAERCWTNSAPCGTGGYSIRARARMRRGGWKPNFRAAAIFGLSGSLPTSEVSHCCPTTA